MRDARTVLTEYYLDFVNNYISLVKFAEHNGLTGKQAEDLLRVAKAVFETKHPEE